MEEEDKFFASLRQHRTASEEADGRDRETKSAALLLAKRAMEKYAIAGRSAQFRTHIERDSSHCTIVFDEHLLKADLARKGAWKIRLTFSGGRFRNSDPKFVDTYEEFITELELFLTLCTELTD